MTQEDSQTIKKSSESVYPESTIDAANQRNLPKRIFNRSPGTGQKDQSSSKLACESTLESANRRNFIRRAALATAVAGVSTSLLGGAVLGKGSVIPSSSASVSKPNYATCCLYAYDSLYTDYNQNNKGCSWKPGLNFGGGGGEGIGSARTSGSPNQYGIDFYTNYEKQMSITNTGKVGIGTHTPSAKLCVQSNICCSASAAGNSSGFAGTGVYGNATDYCGVGVFGGACGVLGIGVYGFAAGTEGIGTVGISGKGCGVGIWGSDLSSGIGVRAASNTGLGLYAVSGGYLIGKFKNDNFCSGADKTALIQIETGDSTPIPWNVGVSGSGNGLSIADGDFYIEQCGHGSRMTIDTCGRVGIGTSAPSTLLDVNGTVTGAGVVVCNGVVNKSLGVATASPQTTLQINGSLSAKIATKTASYSMTTSDFAILANAASGAITITLPSAGTAGMLVHVKKIDTSANAVKVAGSGGNTIEGSTSKSLSKKYMSLTLIADGTSTWYELSSAK
jgi:hypothetical protein